MKPIFTSYASGTRDKDLWANIVTILNPLAWLGNSAVAKLEQGTLADHPNVMGEAFSYNYARSGMYEFFKALDAKQDEEIIYQSFTCVAAVNPAIWAGFKPVFADIDTKTFSYDLSSLKSKISDKTRAIVIQHTFGIPAELEAVSEFAKSKGILILEDCAQIYGNPEIGKYSDAVVFSFGRDKPVGGVNGGMLVVKDSKLSDKIKESFTKLGDSGFIWNYQQAVYQISWGIVRGLWKFDRLSKVFHLLFTRLGLLSRATTPEEKRLIRPKYIPSKMSNILASVTMSQFNDRNEILNQRIENVNYYYKKLSSIDGFEISPVLEGNSLVRFPILTEDRDQLMKYLSVNMVQGGDWYSTPIAPIEVDPSMLGYEKCEITESANSKILNLPTHANIGEEERKRIVELILDFYKEDVSV